MEREVRHCHRVRSACLGTGKQSAVAGKGDSQEGTKEEAGTGNRMRE